MNNQSKLAEAKRQQLKDLLPLPVQRVGRYPLLLKDLLKKTPETHPDYRNLTAAFDKVKELADRVNEKKKEEEEKTGLFEVYRETKDCPARLVSAKRRWINSYAAVDVKNKNKLQVSVFSDLIMISIVNKTVFKSDFKFKFSRWIDILELQITLANDLVLIEILPENASFSRPSNTWPNDIRSLLVAMPRMAEFINCAMLEKKLCVETEQQLFQAKLNLNP